MALTKAQKIAKKNAEVSDLRSKALEQRKISNNSSKTSKQKQKARYQTQIYDKKKEIVQLQIRILNL